MEIIILIQKIDLFCPSWNYNDKNISHMHTYKWPNLSLPEWYILGEHLYFHKRAVSWFYRMLFISEYYLIGRSKCPPLSIWLYSFKYVNFIILVLIPQSNIFFYTQCYLWTLLKIHKPKLIWNHCVFATKIFCMGKDLVSLTRINCVKSARLSPLIPSLIPYKFDCVYLCLVVSNFYKDKYETIYIL